MAKKTRQQKWNEQFMQAGVSVNALKGVLAAIASDPPPEIEPPFMVELSQTLRTFESGIEAIRAKCSQAPAKSGKRDG